MRSFTWIEINCFNRFRFLPEVSTNLQKCTILGNLRTITQEGEKKIRQISPFLIYFLSSVCVTFNFVFENCQNSFSWGPTLVHSFWSTQYLNLEVKAVTLELSSFDSTNIHIEESEKPSFTFSIKLRINPKIFRVIS